MERTPRIQEVLSPVQPLVSRWDRAAAAAVAARRGQHAAAPAAPEDSAAAAVAAARRQAARQRQRPHAAPEQPRARSPVPAI